MCSMKSQNIIQQKSFNFSLSVIKIYKLIIKERKEFVISKQLLKSGTSIGANVEEAIGAQTKKDFTAKMFIAYKEARETRYWVKIIIKSNLMNNGKVYRLYEDIDEICRILGKIISSSRKKY